MSSLKKKTKTSATSTSNTAQNSTATTTPVLPEYVGTNIQNLTGKVNDTFGAIDPKSLVAGPDPLQTQAATAATSFAPPSAFGGAESLFNGVGAEAPASATAGRISAGIPELLNPYLKDVVDTSLADFDFGAGQTRAQDKLDLAGDSTFGGSSGAIKQALTSDMLTRGRGSLAAGLRSHAYDTAGSLAGQQAGLDTQTSIANAGFADSAAGRRLAAASGLTSLGSAQGADARANAGQQFDIGEALRGIQNDKNSAPIDLILKQIAANAGIPFELLKGSTTAGSSTGTSNGTSTGTSITSGMDLDNLIKAAAKAAAAAAVASDIRLKQDIEPIGTDAKGRKWYEYAYIWDPETRHRGVMAQEVIITDPDAVMMHPSGFLMVDYSKLEDA